MKSPAPPADSRAAVRFGLFLLVLSMSGVTAVAQDLRGFWNGSPPSRAVRAAQAQEWRKGFRALDQQIPTLSPSEAAWLRREYDEQIASNDGKFTERAITAMDSKEFNVRRARRHLDLIVEVLGRLTNGGYKTERREITDWARLSSLMADGPFWTSVEDLIERKVVKPEINGVSRFYHLNHAMWASVVVDRVVIPFLEREN